MCVSEHNQPICMGYFGNDVGIRGLDTKTEDLRTFCKRTNETCLADLETQPYSNVPHPIVILLRKE